MSLNQSAKLFNCLRNNARAQQHNDFSFVSPLGLNYYFYEKENNLITFRSFKLTYLYISLDLFCEIIIRVMLTVTNEKCRFKRVGGWWKILILDWITIRNFFAWSINFCMIITSTGIWFLFDWAVQLSWLRVFKRGSILREQVYILSWLPNNWEDKYILINFRKIWTSASI